MVQTVMVLALMGNAVTALGWFPANFGFVPAPVHWFLSAQVFLLAIALLPTRWLPSGRA